MLTELKKKMEDHILKGEIKESDEAYDELIKQGMDEKEASELWVSVYKKNKIGIFSGEKIPSRNGEYEVQPAPKGVGE